MSHIILESLLGLDTNCYVYTCRCTYEWTPLDTQLVRVWSEPGVKYLELSTKLSFDILSWKIGPPKKYIGPPTKYIGTTFLPPKCVGPPNL